MYCILCIIDHRNWKLKCEREPIDRHAHKTFVFIVYVYRGVRHESELKQYLYDTMEEIKRSSIRH